jgi:L-fucose isomerase-like protein
MKIKHRLRIGYVGVSISPYFAEKYKVRETAVAALNQYSDELGFELIAIERPILSAEDAAAAARELQGKDIDFLLIQNAACSMGEQLYPLLDVAPRIGLWSIPDPSQDGEVQLSSLVSMNHYASVIKSYFSDREVPYKWFYGNPDSERFRERFTVTARALKAVTNLERTRIGWIGGISPGFVGMLFDEDKMRERLGVIVDELDLSDVVKRAESIESGRVAESVREIRGAAASITVSDDSAFDRVTRFYLALHDLSREMEYDALAVQCWSTIQQLYNIAPCMAYSWLGSEHDMPVSCEGDVLGAVSMHVLNLLSDRKGSSTLLDLAALDPERQSMMMWHCGVTPRHFANEDGIRWVDHVTLGRNGTDGPYGVAGDQVFAQQPVTLSYVNEDAGQILVVKSEVVDHPSPGFDGTRGWLSKTYLNGEPIDIWDLINTFTVRGLQHHFAMGQGDVTRELMELAAWKKMRLVEPVPYADYLQWDGVNA